MNAYVNRLRMFVSARGPAVRLRQGYGASAEAPAEAESRTLLFQRQHDVLPRRSTGSAATADCRLLAGNAGAASVGAARPAKPCGKQTGAGRDRNNNKLPAVDLIGR